MSRGTVRPSTYSLTFSLLFLSAGPDIPLVGLQRLAAVRDHDVSHPKLALRFLLLVAMYVLYSY
jgi:hypothetical protein